MSGKVLIALSASNAFYGKLLRKALYEHSKTPKDEQVNHAFIVYKSSDWQDWRAVDIQEKGVQPTLPVKHLKRVDYVECYELPDVDLWKGLRSCKNDLYKKYDWIGLIFGFVRLLLALVGWKLKNPIHAHNRLFCSEYVAKVLKKSGAPAVDHWAPANVSPKDLQDYLHHYGKKAPPPTALIEAM